MFFRRFFTSSPTSSVTVTLKSKIQADITASIKARDSAKAGVLRQLFAELVKAEKLPPPRPSEIATLQRCIQRWTAAIEEYQRLRDGCSNEQRSRLQDAIDKEVTELSILRTYLPEPYEKAELEEIIQGVIDRLEIQGAIDSLKIKQPAVNQSGIIMKNLLEILDNDRIIKRELADLVLAKLKV